MTDDNNDMAIPLRIAAHYINFPINQFIKYINPLYNFDTFPEIFDYKNSKSIPLNKQDLLNLYSKLSVLNDEKEILASIPKNIFIKKSSIDKFAYDYADSTLNPEDTYHISLDTHKFPFPDLLDECTHILKLDLNEIVSKQEIRKQATNTRNEKLIEKYKSLKENHQNQSESWYAVKIAREYPDLNLKPESIRKIIRENLN